MQQSYSEFIDTKKPVKIDSGFEVNHLNKYLFPFQEYIVKRALKAGKFAIFADCGLGKTLMALTWAYEVVKYTNKPVILLTPLAVVGQFIEEGNKFDILVFRLFLDEFNELLDNQKIFAINYDQLKNVDTSVFSGVVLDESSILKDFQGATKQLIIDSFKNTPYKLACTATPSPNDPIELGNHAEFLDVMRSKEMVSMFFINDSFNKEKTKSKWRLKKPSEAKYWNWVASWSIMLSKPSDIGFSDEGYVLPALEMKQITVDVPKQDNGKLYNDTQVSATDFYKELRTTQTQRCKKVAEIVNASTENFIIWVKSDDEEKEICSLIPDSVCVNGSQKAKVKEERLLGFSKNEFRVLVTKAKIAQFGLNYQNCHNQIFLSFDFSFEGLYQAIRRSWRFGQKFKVNIWLVVVETMGNVLQTILQKQEKHENMQAQMKKAMNNTIKSDKQSMDNYDIISTNNWTLRHGDSVSLSKNTKSDSIDYIFFSPPFSDLYMFSDDPRDMSNNMTYDQFFEHFEFLIPELLRILKPGRICSIHLTQLSTSIGKDGKLEIVNFRDDVIRSMKKFGWLHHAEVVIRKDPKIIAQRTKAMQLLHATTKRDSTICRMAFPDYIISFKKNGANDCPVNHDKNGIPFEYWCKIADSVWMDIDEGEVINVKIGKDQKDEKHMTPTQKEPIRRLLELYTNPGDLVYSPFTGGGTEGEISLEKGRKFLGDELKQNYFDLSVKNLKQVDEKLKQLSLFKTA